MFAELCSKRIDLVLVPDSLQSFAKAVPFAVLAINLQLPDHLQQVSRHLLTFLVDDFKVLLVLATVVTWYRFFEHWTYLVLPHPGSRLRGFAFER